MPGSQGFFRFLNHFVSAKLDISSIRVKQNICLLNQFEYSQDPYNAKSHSQFSISRCILHFLNFPVFGSANGIFVHSELRSCEPLYSKGVKTMRYEEQGLGLNP